MSGVFASEVEPLLAREVAINKDKIVSVNVPERITIY
jgi:hypothetical protein